MRFFIFKSATAKQGEVCTRERFEEVSSSPRVYEILNQIARCKDTEEIGRLKRRLPVITWQASFSQGQRKNDQAVPSGLFMLDIDKLDSYEAASRTAQAIMGQRERLKIVYVGITPSRKGVRVVAECPEHCQTIAEAQAWLASELGVAYDEACKDWARCSYVVHEEYFRFVDYGMFEREAEVVYDDGDGFGAVDRNSRDSRKSRGFVRVGVMNTDLTDKTDKVADAPTDKTDKGVVDDPTDKVADAPTDKVARGGFSNTDLTDKTDKVADAPTDKVADAPTDKVARGGLLNTDITDKTDKGVVDDPTDKVADAPTDGTDMGVQREYNGVALRAIAEEYLAQTGGEPQIGERNNRLRDLALKMRYITDFNPATICANIPHCGLSESEVMSLCKSACSAGRGGVVPEALRRVLNTLTQPEEEATPADAAQMAQTYQEPLPPLPPIFSHFVRIAPDDFKSATVLCLLPMLGTLGSKLRSHYVTGKVESPSFQVTLEAGQAQGKSFIELLNDIVMRPMKEKDEQSRQLEEEYREEDEGIRTGSTKSEREDYKKKKVTRIVPIIREMGATASLTKVLKRMQAAQGLHLYAMAVELDTVCKAFSRGFSNLSDFLRCAFDNSEYAQDYASDASWSGRVRVYYNVLYSGTPGAVAKFFPDSENGTMSRTLFVTFPDQFGKTNPIWKKFTKKERAEVDQLTQQLYGVSIEKDTVKEAHVMQLGFLNERLTDWCEEQRVLSVESNDRTRNTFYRRCAEVAFRAGMLAFYLWGEKDDRQTMKKVNAFAVWVAEKMLQQFIVRVNEADSVKDNMSISNLLSALPEEFTVEQLEQELMKIGRKTSTCIIISRWTHAGKIEPHEKGARVFRKRVRR